MIDPLHEVLLTENHSEEEKHKEAKVSKEHCCFKKQNCPKKVLTLTHETRPTSSDLRETQAICTPEVIGNR